MGDVDTRKLRRAVKMIERGAARLSADQRQLAIARLLELGAAVDHMVAAAPRDPELPEIRAAIVKSIEALAPTEN